MKSIDTSARGTDVDLPNRSRRRTLIAGLTIAAALLASLDMLADTRSARAIDLRNYTLTFREEFDAIDVSPWGPGTRWIAHTPWGGDFGDARFADPAPDFPFTASGGRLHIEARKFSDGRWRSGLLASVDRAGHGFAQQLGYFEMRAKLPAGEGLWPAFWLIGRSDPTHTAEVDILEHYGKFPDRYTAAVHVWDRTNASNNRSVYHRIPVSSGQLYENFHVFAASVEADHIRVFYDGQEMWKVPTPPEHHQPLYILLDLGLGGGWPIDKAPSPSFMHVDYVRAWSRN